MFYIANAQFVEQGSFGEGEFTSILIRSKKRFDSATTTQ